MATTTASRLTPARRSSRVTPPSGGPPSNSTAVPSGCWMSVASPWPMSRNRTVRSPGGEGEPSPAAVSSPSGDEHEHDDGEAE